MKSFSGNTVIVSAPGYFSRKIGRAKIVLTIFILFLSTGIRAINHYPLPLPEQYLGLKWQLDKTVKGVQFFYALSVCEGSDIVFLKLNNTNKYPVNVSWKETFETQVEKNADGNGDRKKMILQPGETSEADCISPVHKELVVPASKAVPTYVAVISKFSYKDVTVTNAN
ncbi:hypothetical protein [Agriterribacter sp.]|uniref:hypothetical protein n=1 Tax=Agriterribacter sp. TaxID=2821509 RepID=UPI002C9AAC6E|nr:hypothetical protein [Agriterribacter sp.]HRP57698.1 hypothetical protein [Agriterribacter sp.]